MPLAKIVKCLYPFFLGKVGREKVFRNVRSRLKTSISSP